MPLAHGIVVELYSNASNASHNTAVTVLPGRPVLPGQNRITEYGAAGRNHDTRRLRYIAAHPGTRLQVIVDFSGWSWANVTDDILIAIAVHDSDDPNFRRPRTHYWVIPGGTQSHRTFAFRSATVYNAARTTASNVALRAPAAWSSSFTRGEENLMTRFPVDARGGCISVCIQVGSLLPAGTNVTSFSNRATDPPLASFAAVHNAGAPVPIRSEWFTAAINMAQFHFRVRGAHPQPTVVPTPIAAPTPAGPAHAVPPPIAPAVPPFGAPIAPPVPVTTAHRQQNAAPTNAVPSVSAPAPLPARRDTTSVATGLGSSTPGSMSQSTKRQRSQSPDDDTDPATRRRKVDSGMNGVAQHNQPIRTGSEGSTIADGQAIRS